jgi:hypothetical protein
MSTFARVLWLGSASLSMTFRALYNFLLLRDIEPNQPELREEPGPISGHSATLPCPPPPSHVPDVDDWRHNVSTTHPRGDTVVGT